MAGYECVVQGVFLSDDCDHSIALDLVISVVDITLDRAEAWGAIEYCLGPESSNGDDVAHSNPFWTGLTMLL